MDNSQIPPNQIPMQKPDPFAPQPPSDGPGLPPGTFEYVDESKKRNVKRIIEIAIVVVIAAVPLIMSLFKPEYSLQRSYAVLNPASYISGQSSQTWGSIITTAKKIIQPETKTTQENNQVTAPEEENILTNTPTTTQEPTISVTEATQETAYPTLTQKQIEVIKEVEEEQQNSKSTEEDPTPSPTQSYIFYPSTPEVYEQDGEDNEEPTATPTPTVTPTTLSPYAACYGKKKGDKCSYTSSSGKKTEGRCKTTFGGSLICVKD